MRFNRLSASWYGLLGSVTFSNSATLMSRSSRYCRIGSSMPFSFAPPPGGYLFSSSAVRSSVNRTLRVHGCSLAFGDG
jgi:hypothetical protein